MFVQMRTIFLFFMMSAKLFFCHIFVIFLSLLCYLLIVPMLYSKFSKREFFLQKPLLHRSSYLLYYFFNIPLVLYVFFFVYRYLLFLLFVNRSIILYSKFPVGIFCYKLVSLYPISFIEQIFFKLPRILYCFYLFIDIYYFYYLFNFLQIYCFFILTYFLNFPSLYYASRDYNDIFILLKILTN